METGIYILKSVTVLSIFYVVYFIFLRKDTLFTIKRHYLLGGIITSLLFPFIKFTKTTYLQSPILAETQLLEKSGAFTEATLPSQEVFLVEWWHIGLSIYAIGVLVFIMQLVFQLFSLLKLLSRYPSSKRGKYRFVKISEEVSPFSFFRYIVYNPLLHSDEELEMILKHEQVHAAQWHSIDIILANMVRCLQWINPFSWFYKKSIEENLEFIADNETATQVTSKKQYQLTLVKASSPLIAPALTTQFYQSFIKKRIIMLNKSTSKRRNIWKVCIVLPILALFLWSFSVEEVFEYEKAIAPTAVENPKAIFNIFTSTTDSELDYIEKTSRTSFESGAIQIADRKRDAQGELKAFSFATKFGKQDRYYNRFTTTNNRGYEIRFTEGPLIVVTELSEKGVQFKISKENLVFSEEMPIRIENVNLKKQNVQIDSFQVKKKLSVINQSSTSKQLQTTSPEFRVKITKDTSDEQLNRIKKEMSKEHGIDLSYTVVRNSKKEITSINIHYNGNGTSGAYSVNEDGPIEDFHFYMTSEGNSGFQSANNSSHNLHNNRSHNRLENKRNNIEKTEEEEQQEREEQQEQEEELHDLQNELRHLASEMKNEERSREEHQKELAIAQEHQQHAQQQMTQEAEEMKRVEKEAEENYSRSKTQHSNHSIVIDKNTSDADLKGLKNDLRSQGISFDYSKLRRNSKGEISRLKITIDNGKGSKSTTTVKAKNGDSIDDIVIEI